MSSTTPRRTVRLALALVASALPLVGAGAAQAAIFGNPAKTTLPDLTSASVLAGTHTVEACFDKVLEGGGPGVPGAFTLGGYRASNISAPALSAPVDPFHNKCSLVTFDPSVGDMSQFTVLEVAAGAVTSNASLQQNLDDAVLLTQPRTVRPTRPGAATSVPNLISILAPTGTNFLTNSLTFVFDKSVSDLAPAAGPDGTLFFLVDTSGNICPGTAPVGFPSGGSSSVTVSFLGCPSVFSAVRGGTVSGAVASLSDTGSTNPNQSLPVNGVRNGGRSGSPALTGARLGANKDSIIYTFDQSVIVDPATLGAGTFLAELSNGVSVPSVGATRTSPNTVTASFGGALSQVSGYAIAGVVSGTGAGAPAVDAADNPVSGNVPGSASLRQVGGIGGLVGRTGTSGPDVTGVTVARHGLFGSTVTVNLDKRVDIPVNAAGITLLDPAGSPIPVPLGFPTVSFDPSAALGKVTLQYPAGILTNVAAVAFSGTNTLGSVFTTTGAGILGLADASNIAQIVSPINSAAILKGYKVLVAHRGHHVARIHRMHHKKR